MIVRAWRADSISVERKRSARNVVAGAHLFQRGGIGGQNRAELGVAVLARSRVHAWHSEVVNHPTFVPTTLVVDDEHSRDVGKDVDEGAWIVWINWEPRFRFQHNPNCADGRKAAIAAGDGQLNVVIYPRKYCREDVWFKTGSIEEIVLKELARRIGFCKHLQWHDAVWPIRQLSEPILQRHG